MTELPDFRERWPWRGGDLQTVRNILLPPRVRFDGAATRTLIFPMDDGTGDILNGALHEPLEGSAPLIVLIHGLTGCFDSEYIRVSARYWLGRGHPVLRVNLRAAGPINDLCREQYYAGRTQDLVALFAALKDAAPHREIIAIGFSLGGNVLLKYLGEAGEDAVPAAGVSVSAPLDLAATSDHFERPRNFVYRHYLVRRMRAMTLALKDLAPDHAAAVHRVRTVRQFDDAYIAPRYGFGDADTYYTKNSAAPFLPAIRKPTLVVHSDNDPWIPVAPYRRVPWAENPMLTPALMRGGGHVGFHGRGTRIPWHDRATAVFLAAQGLDNSPVRAS